MDELVKELDPELVRNDQPDLYAVDKDGATMPLLYLDGHFLHMIPKSKHLVSSLRDMPTRPDDVFISAFPKCGTNWVYEIANMLLCQDSTPIHGTKIELFMEFTREEFRDTYPSPRVLNTHLRTNFFPTEAIKKNNKIIVIVRNPKDVLVSLYNQTITIQLYQYSGKFDAYIDLFLGGRVPYGSYFEYVCDWERFVADHPDNPILVLHYEHLHRDVAAGVRKLAEFLDVPCSDSLLGEIVENVKIANMKVAKNRLNSLGDFAIMFRKGLIGDWRNHLTQEQSDRVDEVTRTEMANSSIVFDYGDD